MKIHRSAAIYFALQGGGVIIWWGLLFFSPPVRESFQMGNGEDVLLSFWLPDLFLLATGSLAAAWYCWLDSSFKSPAIWFVAGTISYASLYCLAFAFRTDTGWLGVTFMLPAMLWSLVFGVGLSKPTQKFMFRTNRSEQSTWILFKTFSQIFVVWTLILVIFPYFIVQLEIKLGVPHFSFPLQTIISPVLFVLISSIGLASAFLMSKVGKGTPLPLDTAPNLVIRGIYSHVRNPMAISGIGQGLIVGLFLGSPFVLIYALMGAVIWQLIFRPLEEADLLKRFGREYQEYRKNVRCWIPNLKPYRGTKC